MAPDSLQRGPIAPRPRTTWIGFVLAAAGAVVTLWFLQRILTALLLLFLIIVVAMALSVPVAFFRRRGMGRRLAPALVLLLFIASLALVGWLVIPRVAAQVILLVERLPDLLASLNAQFADLLDRHPELQGMLAADGGPPDLSPAALGVFTGVGNFSLGLLGAVALTIIFLSGVISVVSDPKPVLRAYIASLPTRHRFAGVRAYRRAQRSIAGWTKATLIIGIIEFVAVFAFLTLLGVPGALVWAALAFFVEFIPRIGNYLMAIPPVLVSLTVGPMTAIWVALFYFLMGEIIGGFVAPRIGGAAMAIHPLLLLFFALAFALAFGLLGALVATPAAAFFTAYYSEFYLRRHQEPLA